MKTINKNTTLKCEDKTYLPVEINEVIYWIDTNGILNENSFVLEDKKILSCCNRLYLSAKNHLLQSTNKIISQSRNVLESVPVINLDNYAKDRYKYLYGTDFDDTEVSLLEWQAFKLGYNSNKGYYSKEDIEKAIDLYRELGLNVDKTLKTNVDNLKQEIFKQINSISIIEIDEFFNILGYE